MDDETKNKLITIAVVIIIIAAIWFVVSYMSETSYVDDMVQKIYEKQDKNLCTAG